MRTATKSISTLIGAGIVTAVLAGCTPTVVAGAGAGAGDAAGTASSAPAVTAPSATPTSSPTPALESDIGGGSTAIALDPGFLSALSSLKLTPGVLNTAKLSSDGVLTFPVTGGHVTVYDPATGVRPYVQGEIDHEDSGLSLSAGGQEVDLRNLVIDPGNNSHVSGDVFLNGKSVVRDANLFRLDGSTLEPITQNSDGDYVLRGTTVYVSSDAAALLNKTFDTDAVTDQLKVGVATVTISAKQ